tara:strand:+ start:12448 stop:12654 length:207 start_codon:yes stop_codon:yes gene_type:complete
MEGDKRMSKLISPKQSLVAELNAKYESAGLPKPKFSSASVGMLDYAIERIIQEGAYLTVPQVNERMKA